MKLVIGKFQLIYFTWLSCIYLKQNKINKDHLLTTFDCILHSQQINILTNE